MSAPDPAWAPEAYPAPVLPSALAQVIHSGRLIFVRADRFDEGAPLLDVFTKGGLYARRKVLACEVEGWRAETVTLHDGPARQHLVPGVAAVPLTTRQLVQEAQRRAGRRGDAPLPSGGLWDETARLQQDLF